MNLPPFLRIVRFAWQNFWRNIWLSVVTVSILVLTLFLFSTVWVVQVLADQTLESVRSKVDVSLFFSPDAPTTDLVTYQRSLEERQDVTSVQYVSPQEALDRFRENNADNETLIATLDALTENPLGPSLIVRAKQLEDYPAILATLDGSPLAQFVQDKDEDFETTNVVIERLSALTSNVRRIGLVIASIFALVTFLVVFNTIRIMIYSHREEIGIMKLVGASNTFVRAPFLVEAFLYGTVATIVTSALFVPLLNVVAPVLNRFFTGYDLDVAGYFNGHLIELVAIQLVVAIGISAVSSGTAVSRYLRV